MELFNGILIALGSIALVLMTRSITTLLHELGHAIPALLLTNGPVEVHVGSYGDTTRSFFLNLGRLGIYFKFNILAWYSGLCSRQALRNFRGNFIITLGGPITSLLIAILLIYFIRSPLISDFGLFIMSVLFASSVWDFLVNIIPSSTPIPLYDGSRIYNDGHRLRELLSEGGRHAELYSSLELVHSESKAASIQELLKMDKVKRLPRQAGLKLVRLLLDENRIQEAADKFNQIFENGKIRSKDYELFGDIHYGLNNIREAIEAWNKYLHIHYQDWRVINKRARAMLDLGYQDAAIKEIESSLNLNSAENLEALLNRVRLGLQSGALVQVQEDLLYALKLDKNAPIVHLNYGHYYEKIGDYIDAETHYRKAKALGTTYHGIDLKIEQMSAQNR